MKLKQIIQEVSVDDIHWMKIGEGNTTRPPRALYPHYRIREIDVPDERPKDMGYLQDPLAVFDDDVRQFAIWMASEVQKARKKFPSPEGSMTALTEEVGELAQAMLEKAPVEVIKEAVQVAGMACRIAMEGDPSLNNTRAKRVNVGGDWYHPPQKEMWWRQEPYWDLIGASVEDEEQVP